MKMMNEESTTSADGQFGNGERRAFAAANAEFFAQALAPINELFRNSGTMNIVSDELDYTVVVGMRTTGEDDVVDVDCALLEAGQDSLRDSLDALFI